MSGRAIVITSGKGGVGKTTTTANLGAALAMKGKRTLVIDGDIGLRNLDVIMGLENRIVYNLVDIVKGNCRPQQALIKSKKNSNLYLLPASQTDDKDVVSEKEMQELIKKFKAEFHFILIDSPAGIEQGFKNSVAGADEALLVTTPEVSAVRDADRVIGLLAARAIEPQLIINRLDADMVKRGDMMSPEDVVEILAIKQIGLVYKDDAIIVSANNGEPVAYDSKSKSAKAYMQIAERITGGTVSDEDLSLPNTFWSKIGKALRVA